MWSTKIANFVGTPGQVNSVFGPFLEATAKQKLHAIPQETPERFLDMLVGVFSADREHYIQESSWKSWNIQNPKPTRKLSPFLDWFAFYLLLDGCKMILILHSSKAIHNIG